MEGGVTGTVELAELEPFQLENAAPLFGVLLPFQVWKCRVVPISIKNGHLVCAMDDPYDADTLDLLYHLLNLNELDVIQVSAEELNAYMFRYFPDGEVVGRALRHRALDERDKMVSEA
jgi:hypothetical protein